mmetsp:Transcript_405/g.1386  ORF Transcript_405/g.1386 Transcript_405/m.1386 type:complete len:265 (-) Transcript_405:59-853(-)
MGAGGEQVWLYMYDLTKGAAKNVPSWALGFQLDAIWHTGIVAFGYEYYFARDAVRVQSGSTVFGAPQKQIKIGTTYRTEPELRRYICEKLKPMFHNGTYCVVTNNCNHFSDEILMFLTGKHLPDDVLRQPELLMKVQTVRWMRPLLNLVLGHYVTDPPAKAEELEKDVVTVDAVGERRPSQKLKADEIISSKAIKQGAVKDMCNDITPSEVGELEDLLLWLDRQHEVPEEEPPQIPEVTHGGPVRLGLASSQTQGQYRPHREKL